MKNDPRRSFWRAAGPLLGFWGIQLVMEFVIEFIIILPFMGEASSRMTQSGEVLNYQEMMNKYYEVLSPAFDKIIGGQIAIAGIATAATLFLTVTLFVIDRKKERIAGIQRMGGQKPLKNYWSLLVMGVIGSIGATCLSAMAQAVLVDPEYIQTAQNMYSADFVVQIIVFGFCNSDCRGIYVPRSTLSEVPGDQRILLCSNLDSTVFLSHTYQHGTDDLHFPLRNSSVLCL